MTRLSQISEYTFLEPAEETQCAHFHDEAVADQSKLLNTTCAIKPSRDEPVIYNAALPNGRQIPLLKTLLTSACERDCYYCPFRAGRDFHRETFKPDEMSDLFMGLVKGGVAKGLFLSSGIAGGGIRTQDRLIDTAEILREKRSYQGYLHLKIMPGSEKDQVIRAMQLANRVSINLEAPNNQRLPDLAPHKVFLEELLRPLQWAEEYRRNNPSALSWNRRWPSLATQFVVGGSSESDLELLTTSNYLYRQLHLGRVYYSAFKPIPGTPLENKPAENPLRQDRLYQASFLIRDYGFDLEELPFLQSGNLPLDVDPKMAWASEFLVNPVEINKANRQQLLRIPGVGPKNADKILNARHQQKFSQPEDLQKIGINVKRMLPFILLDGRHPTRQLSFYFS